MGKGLRMIMVCPFLLSKAISNLLVVCSTSVDIYRFRLLWKNEKRVRFWFQLVFFCIHKIHHFVVSQLLKYLYWINFFMCHWLFPRFFMHWIAKPFFSFPLLTVRSFSILHWYGNDQFAPRLREPSSFNCLFSCNDTFGKF